jgi:hypothetical protein
MLARCWLEVQHKTPVALAGDRGLVAPFFG